MGLDAAFQYDALAGFQRLAPQLIRHQAGQLAQGLLVPGHQALDSRPDGDFDGGATDGIRPLGTVSRCLAPSHVKYRHALIYLIETIYGQAEHPQRKILGCRPGLDFQRAQPLRQLMRQRIAYL